MIEAVQDKTCPRCGGVFGCRASAPTGPGCWCEALPALKTLTGEDCLCPACLAAAVARQEPSEAADK